ncbi:MAG: ABC transporter ATP-binding protein [Oscillospiraceae bacterium]|nr:ABC transporter ATP-binding protein [Oscillospiraceae bacterium]
MRKLLFGKHVNRYYGKYFPRILLGLIALITIDYVQLEIPRLYRMVINGLNTGSAEWKGAMYTFDLDFLLDRICLPMLMVILVMLVGRFLWRICFFGAGINVETDLRSRMFDRCKDLSQQYYQTNKVGNLMALFTGDLDTIQECFGWGIMMFCDAVFLGIMAMIKMLQMNKLLALLSLIPMIFLLIVSTTIGKYMMKKWEYRQERYADLSDFAQENLSGIAVIKAFVKEGKELFFFRKLNSENEQANVSFTRTATLMRVSVMLFVESVICVILGYGGYLVYTKTFNAGQLVEYIGYFTSIVWPIMAVSELIDMMSRGKGSLKRVSELLDAEIDVVDGPNVREPEKITGEIEFRDLTFAYPGDGPNVLKDLSFTIRAGESIGVIGRTGAGKSTLVDLLLRTYNVPEGTVFLDGQDITTIPIRTVRENAAYVPQDNFLFSDTIANNIAFSADEYDLEGVENAAKLADVHENIVEFSHGYETILGERGVTVSGGQKQRISIARALWKNAPILILDDSVSAVDVKTEQVILRNLRDLRQGKTTIVIAHRISTLESMDRILFLEDGAMVDFGNHKELYDRCDAYRRMVELQRLDDGKEDEE